MELWKQSPLGPEHVEVSSLGRVRTKDRIAPSARDKQPTQLKAGKVLSPWVNAQGYLTVSVKEGDRRPKYSVHRLVAAAFCEGFIPGLSVNHIDGDKLNNLPSNLEWVTLQRNTAMAWETGQCQNFGDNCTFTRKLSEADVSVIRQRLSAGDSPKAIASDYSVARDTVYAIKSGERRTREIRA